MSRVRLRLLLWLLMSALLCLVAWATMAQAQAITYDIVYVRAPRYGDTNIGKLPQVKDPIDAEPGSDLMLLHPDGTEEVLVAGGVAGAVMDPKVSFDKQWVYYAHFPDVVDRDANVSGMVRGGADIWKINLATRQKIKLPLGSWTPNTGVTVWSSDPLKGVPAGTSYPGHHVVHTGPCPLPGGKLIFTSNMNGHLSNKSFTVPNFQLFVFDEATSITEQIGYLNLGSALHPVVLMDGRVMFSSYESQGTRDPRLWGLWAIWPDGRTWEPLLSAFDKVTAAHYQTQLSDGTVSVVRYYNQNNNGFGTLEQLAVKLSGPMNMPVPYFGSPDPALNVQMHEGYLSDGTVPRMKQIAFSPPAFKSLTPFAHANDEAASKVSGVYQGKVTMPAAGPNNDVLLVWTPGPGNDKGTPKLPLYDAGIYLLKRAQPAMTKDALVLVKNDPAYNEQQPQPVLSYQEIYGIPEPTHIPWLPNNGSVSPHLPAGTPFGLIGTSGFYKHGIKAVNQESNCLWVGCADPELVNSEIHAVRLLQMEPFTFCYGPQSQCSLVQKNKYRVAGNERLRIMGEIPLRKFNTDGSPMMDVDGNPDTSFLAKIPANVAFTFQLLDDKRQARSMAMTWHQLRPGEKRVDCGGCHFHQGVGTKFEQTAASQPWYAVHDLTQNPPVDVEYLRDIKAIFQRVNPALVAKTWDQLVMQNRVKPGEEDKPVHPFQSYESPLFTQLPGATEDELRLIRTWVDLGAPHNLGGWFTDEQRPTLTMHVVSGPHPKLRVGAYDAKLGTNAPTVTLDGQPVALVASSDPFIWEAVLPVTGQGVFVATVEDAPGLSGKGNMATLKLAAQW